MPSPFPGMDPYLESPAQWPDFHHELITSCRGVIADRLPDNYVARINELVLKIEPELEPRRKVMGPDVLVGRRYSDLTRPASVGPSTVADLEPVTIANIVHLDSHREGFIEIYRMPGYELVTVLELLSTDKTGDGRGQYVAKRETLLEQRVNMIELDLIRAGTRLQLSRSLPPADYYALISRGDRRPDCQVYHWTVRHPLPVLPVPLKSPDGDIQVGLADAFSTAYQRGRYDKIIHYDESPPPPSFAAEDADWVVQVAQAAVRS